MHPHDRRPPIIRRATPADIPELQRVIAASARGLRAGFYTSAATESAIAHVFGVDSQLIADGTYFVAELDDHIVGCGGWSWRRTLYGGDQRPMGGGSTLDPAVDAARIRAFFVAPDAARRRVGSTLLAVCADEARRRGFTRLELMSTLPGVPFYRALGFAEDEAVTDVLPDGTPLAFVRMTRTV